MAGQTPSAHKSPIVLGAVVGGFVWLVFDSLALGMIAGFATFILIQRDRKEDAGEE